MPYKDPKKREEYEKSSKRKESRKKYNSSEARKLSRKRFRQSQKHKDYQKEYKKTEKFKNWIKQYRKTIIPTTNSRLARNLRCRLLEAIKCNYKNGSAVRDLGCSIAELKAYLESKFQSGMSWDNYGRNGWHIDHIIPLAAFDLTNKDDLLKACHYTNLQPLWATDNLKKGDRTFKP